MYYIFLHTQPPSSTLQVHKNSYETCQDYKPDQSMSVVMLNLRKILYFASHHFTSHLGTRLEIIVLHEIPNFAKGRQAIFREKKAFAVFWWNENVEQKEHSCLRIWVFHAFDFFFCVFYQSRQTWYFLFPR